MSDKTKTTAELAADETAATLEAVETPEPAKPTGVDAAKAEARARELERQAAVVRAVRKAGRVELPELGGPLMDPGLGR